MRTLTTPPLSKWYLRASVLWALTVLIFVPMATAVKFHELLDLKADHALRMNRSAYELVARMQPYSKMWDPDPTEEAAVAADQLPREVLATEMTSLGDQAWAGVVRDERWWDGIPFVHECSEVAFKFAPKGNLLWKQGAVNSDILWTFSHKYLTPPPFKAIDRSDPLIASSAALLKRARELPVQVAMRFLEARRAYLQERPYHVAVMWVLIIIEIIGGLCFPYVMFESLRRIWGEYLKRSRASYDKYFGGPPRAG